MHEKLKHSCRSSREPERNTQTRYPPKKLILITYTFQTKNSEQIAVQAPHKFPVYSFATNSVASLSDLHRPQVPNLKYRALSE
jgi:hypothetical protein